MRYAICLVLLASAGPAWGAAPPVVRRDLLGDPLPRHALFRLGTNRLRTPDIVSGVALSPDGRVATAIASVGMTTPLLLWDLPSGRPRVPLEVPAGRMLNNLLFSPDGKTLTATASVHLGEFQTGFCVWDVASGKLRAATSVPGKAFSGWAFSSDGKILAGSRVGQGLMLFDAATGRELRAIEAAQLAEGRIAFSPDGTLLAVPMLDATITVFRVATGKLERTLPGDKGRAVLDLAFAPDGRRLATLPQGGGVRIVDLRTGKPESTLPLDTKEPGCRIHYTEGGRVLVALDSKGGLSRLDARTGKELSRWAGGRERFRAFVGVSDDAKNPILFGEWGSCELRLVDLRRGVEAGPVVAGHAGPVNFLAVSPDGRRLAAGSGSGWNPVIRLWDLTTGKPGRELVGHAGGLTSLVWSPDGKRLASASGQDESRLWEPRTGRCLHALPLKEFNWPVLAFAPDGKHLAASGFKHVKGMSVGLLSVWDLGSMKQTHRKETLHRPVGTAFLDDVTLASKEGGELRFRDIGTAEPARSAISVDIRNWIHDASADGGRLAGLTSEDRPCILEAQTGITLTRLRVVPLTSVFALSPDGDYLALCTEAGRIELFDATSGAALAEFRHPAAARDVALAFSPDNTRLLSGGSDCTVLVWDVRAALRGRVTVAQPLDAARRRKHWTALGSREPENVRAAWIALRADPQGTLLLADAEFRAIHSAKTAERVRRLIADLDADSFAERERASKELAAVGERAGPALRRATQEGGSAEVKKRAADLLRLLGEDGFGASQLRTLRAVRLLERIDGPRPTRLLRRLAAGDAHDPVTRAAVAALRRRKTRAADEKE